jgi:hypothetical protein
VAHGAAHAVHATRHIVRIAVRGLHHAAAAPHSWVELVCKVIPPAIVGTGLLVPHLLPSPPPPPPPPIVAEAPPVSPPWLTSPSNAPATPVQPYPTPTPVESSVPAGPPLIGASPVGSLPPTPIDIPEPSSAELLLAGGGGLVLVRLIARRSPRYASGSAGGS